MLHRSHVSIFVILAIYKTCNLLWSFFIIRCLKPGVEPLESERTQGLHQHHTQPDRLISPHFLLALLDALAVLQQNFLHWDHRPRSGYAASSSSSDSLFHSWLSPAWPSSTTTTTTATHTVPSDNRIRRYIWWIIFTTIQKENLFDSPVSGLKLE